ncbi:MAG: DUF4388 domain-containing protein [Deltaproteobacteria bacterium]|jgi:hypothetical protein|nr:DUF4388 domain-containing protein [Deltaproteobacteria bacterium]
MALRGNVEEYGLPDLLQLIVKGNKSGLLVLESPTEEITLRLSEAWVIGAETDRPSDAKLGTRLQRAGLLTHGELGMALKKRVESGAPLAKILVELGYATEESIRQYVTLLATDLIFEVFTWKTGTYAFEEGPMSGGTGWLEPISVEYLLLQGIVLIDEWPTIQERIPSPNYTVLDREELPPEEESEDLVFPTDETTESDARLPIGDNERLIHELALPGTDVQTLIDRAPFNRFETCRCLSILLGGSYLTLTRP